MLAAVCSVKNKREYMEDRFTAQRDLVPGTHLIAVYDGHSGSGMAQFCADNVPDVLRERVRRSTNETFALREVFAQVEYQAFANAAVTNPWRSGTTACLGLIQPGEGSLHTAHVGDSRMVMKTNGTVHALTRDHNVFYPLERERIQQHGGFIVPDAFGVQRVMGALNLTRSLGDGWLKPFISSAPVVSRFALDGSEEYAVVGTDGLFDVMTNRDVMYIVDSFMDGRTKRQCVKPAPINVARELVNTAVARGSMDNVTAVWASWT